MSIVVHSRLLNYIIMNKLCFNFANQMYLSRWVYDYPFHCNKTTLKMWCSLWVSAHPNCIFHFLSISTFLGGVKKLKALMQNYLKYFPSNKCGSELLKQHFLVSWGFEPIQLETFLKGTFYILHMRALKLLLFKRMKV